MPRESAYEGSLETLRAPGTCCPEPMCDYVSFRYFMRLAPDAMECDMCCHPCSQCKREGNS